MTDAHKYRYNVHYKYTGQFGIIEKWLRQNCAGNFDVIADKKPFSAKSDGSMNIYFKRESDRDRFRDHILGGY